MILENSVKSHDEGSDVVFVFTFKRTKLFFYEEVWIERARVQKKVWCVWVDFKLFGF